MSLDLEMSNIKALHFQRNLLIFCFNIIRLDLYITVFYNIKYITVSIFDITHNSYKV